jgi:predicted nuclease of predicted toxin-antitoxin system
VKFLIDNNLSPSVAHLLNEAGHDAVHVRDYDMRAATDPDVMDRACDEDRVLVSADTDFGALLAQRGTDQPSLLVVRRLSGRRATEQAAIILANLDTFTDDLDTGAIVVLADDYLRIRRLPILPR